MASSSLPLFKFSIAYVLVSIFTAVISVTNLQFTNCPTLNDVRQCGHCDLCSISHFYSLKDEGYFDALAATELGTMGTHDGVLQLSEADVAVEYLRYGRVLGFRSPRALIFFIRISARIASFHAESLRFKL